MIKGTDSDKPTPIRFKLIVDQFSMGDTILLDKESIVNDKNLSIFYSITITLALATAVCCYFTYNFSNSHAGGIFAILFVGSLLDLFIFRNLIILGWTYYLHRKANKEGYLMFKMS
jgi:hypothetical protein